jgi:hypothetical protein
LCVRPPPNKSASRLAGTPARRHGKSGPGNCAACRHTRRDLIDIALILREPRSVLSQRFGISEDSLARHASNHLPPQIRAAIMTAMAPSSIDIDALQKSESESLLASLISQRARFATMAQAALAADLPGVAVRCENGVLQNLELTSRLLGQLVNRSVVTTQSFLVSPDYLRLRSILIEELREYPELRARLAARIAELETEAAAAITSKAQPAMIEHQAQP